MNTLRRSSQLRKKNEREKDLLRTLAKVKGFGDRILVALQKTYGKSTASFLRSMSRQSHHQKYFAEILYLNKLSLQKFIQENIYPNYEWKNVEMRVLTYNRANIVTRSIIQSVSTLVNQLPVSYQLDSLLWISQPVYQIGSSSFTKFQLIDIQFFIP